MNASKQPSNTPKKVQPFNKNPQQNSEGPKNPKNKGWLNKFSNTKKPVLSIQIYSDRLLLIAGPFNLFDEALKTLIKSLGGSYSQEDRAWLMPKSNAQIFLSKLPSINNNLIISSTPEMSNKVLMPFRGVIEYWHNSHKVRIEYSADELQKSVESLPDYFRSKLYDFQRKGIEFGVKNFGRVLIADEMVMVDYNQQMFIALIGCRKDDTVIGISTLRYNWRNEIRKWFNKTDRDIQMITKSATELNGNAQYFIFSYDLATKMIDQITNFGFQMVILDEAHYIKNTGTKRTDTILPAIKAMKRVILLTGTPAFARPKELFNLLQALRPDVFVKFRDFGNRYCDPKVSRWSGGYDYDGASHTRELRYVLQNSVMIRRLKKEVLSELPPKRRQKVEVETDPAIVAKIKAMMNKTSVDYGNVVTDLVNQHYDANDDLDGQIDAMKKGFSGEALQIIQMCYSLTGQAKLKGLRQYIKDVIESEVKFLIFAHHFDVLDGIEEEVKAQKVEYIRIDGTVSAKARQDRVDEFQEREQIKVAILSLTACSVGLNLTAASTVIFAEMNWTPAVMIQAEDRAHRLGQKEKNSINCHYIYGEGTLDELMFDKLEAKLAIVSDIIDGEESLNAERAQRGELNIPQYEESKNQKSSLTKGSPSESGAKKVVPRTHSITSYFQPVKKDKDSSNSVSRDQLDTIKETSKGEWHAGSNPRDVSLDIDDVYDDDDLLDQLVENMLQESKHGTPAKSDPGTSTAATKYPMQDVRTPNLFDNGIRSALTSYATTPQNVDKSRSVYQSDEKRKLNAGPFLFAKDRGGAMENDKKISTGVVERPATNGPKITPGKSNAGFLFNLSAEKRGQQEQLQPHSNLQRINGLPHVTRPMFPMTNNNDPKRNFGTGMGYKENTKF